MGAEPCNPRVLIITPEVTYLPDRMGSLASYMTAKAGGLADVSAALIRALFDQGADVHVAIPNYRAIFADRLTPIAEPRLDADSETAWYLVGNPNQVDTVEVAYLEGEEQPYTDEQPLFEQDAIGFKIRHDFGCGVMDHVGFYKNAGA